MSIFFYRSVERIVIFSTNESNICVLVHLKKGKANIDTTTIHPFWVIGKGWVSAGDLKENDKVLLASGEIETIDKMIIEELKESVKVYNFEVDEWHTYFVSDIGVFVHNMCAETPPNGKAQAEVPQMTRREAFRQAKQDAGIPKSSQYKTHKYVYDGTSENRTVYEFKVDGKKKYIVEHAEDKMGRGPHFRGADHVKGNPFEKGGYNQYDGHYPEDFNGYKK